jgi:large subunit ribosomal protein L24e
MLAGVVDILCPCCAVLPCALQVRQASREAAIREVKERQKKAKAEKSKAASKAAPAKSQQKAAAVGRGKR